MAEIVALVGSVGQLAGATAAVSLTLFECARTMSSAISDLHSLASDASDLSSVLEHLGEVLEKHQDQIVAKTTLFIRGQMNRCETVIEQLKITAELALRKSARIQWLFRKAKTKEIRHSLEGFKSNLNLVMQTLILAKSLENDVAWGKDGLKRRISAANQRNISRLQSAVLSNKTTIEELKEAENKINEEEEEDLVERSTTYSFTPPPYAETRFLRTKSVEALRASRQTVKRDLESVQESSNMMVRDFDSTPVPTWETVLLKSYDSLNKEPPASRTLASLPWQKSKSASSASRKYHAYITEEVDADAEVGTLLKEWTNVSDDAMRMYRDHAKKEEKKPETVPPWVPDEYTFKGGDESDPTNWEPKPAEPPRPATSEVVVRNAYEAAHPNRVPLCNILADKGGGWVWRHDNGNQRDYYVGTRKVLHYTVKEQDNQTDGNQFTNRTIVSKQWISKAILEQGGYTYKAFGEGGWAIARKMTPSEVSELHISASNRTELLLQKLAKSSVKQVKPEPRKPKQIVMAVHTFAPRNAENGELPFKCGDILELFETEGQWRLASLNGLQGRIPFNYVKVIGNSDGENSLPDHPTTSPSSAGSGDKRADDGAATEEPGLYQAECFQASSNGGERSDTREKESEQPKSGFSRFRVAMESYLDKFDKRRKEKEDGNGNPT